MITKYTEILQRGQDLTLDEMSTAMGDLLNDKISDSEKAEFLKNLSKKGETDEELYAMLNEIDRHGIHINPACRGTIIDVCGTGGDRLQTFNISTTAAFVIAASGGIVAKHGNRSVSGISGSADIFEYFGYDLNAPPEKITKIIEKFGIGFMFAQKFHPSMKNVANARKMIGARTAFNLLGPLCNPAQVKNQLIGVFAEDYLERTIRILKRRGAENIMTVHSNDGLDELSTTGKNKVCFLKNGKTETMVIDPEKFGLHKASINDIQISSKAQAIQAFLSVLNGTANRSMLEITVLNAAGGLMVSNIAENFTDAIEIARQTIKNEKAYSLLTDFVRSCGQIEKLREAES
ncbi:anthranilate phosphoribosyltransferase [Candidatus Nitrosotenuis sp. DW1]|uniref:anthranilate phosphoribosyltransferase n=1 Tax=Candidatus Nitrosotenuis sp. DW1 TaxID=2259672 RepID=UPI0015C7DB15|nr:anthranilate phosphoribosyltransferase [Candidatus Nitrosotenuis sp. DW1]QLH08983.1 anthranilate phosphoribosyltransferase [Candidatus Nitrosotenuis sp. DW1]